MSADRQPLPRTGQDVIPSYYNPARDRHEVVQGRDGVPLHELVNAQELVDSTTTPLGAGGSYTGTPFSVAGWGRIVGSVYSDQAGTLYVEQSPDGANWDIATSINYAAGTTPGFSVEVMAPEARLRYVNGAAAQTVFRLHAFRRRA